MPRIVRAERRGPALMPRAIATAHDTARGIVERAERAADSIAERAHAQGVEAARAELAARLLELERTRDAVLDAARGQVQHAAQLAAEHVICAELVLAPERITAIVEEQLTRVRRARRAVLHVHPDDLAPLRTWLDARTAPTAIELVADAAVMRGGCVVVSDIGTIDARVETRLERLQAALERAAGST